MNLRIDHLGLMNLSSTTKAIARSLERLSTGQRLNRPSDDPSAYALSVQLDSQVRAFNQSLLHMNQAQAMLMTADVALQTQAEIAQNMRELAVQASSESLSASDREQLEQQLHALMTEFNRITRETSFNGQALLDGSLDSQNIQLGVGKNQSIDLSLASTAASEIFTKDVGFGAFAPAATVNTGLSFGAGTELADLNGDGHLDLIVSTSEGNIEVHDGRGDGSFKQARVLNPGYLEGSPIVRIKSGDINGDGKLDLIADDTKNIVIMLGQGDGSFASTTTYNVTGQDIYDLEISDINNDNKLDVLTMIWDGDNSTLKALLNDGSGGLSTSFETTLAGGYNEIEAADFNGDGKQDIAWGGNSFGEVRLYHGSGTGTFSLSSTFTFTGSSYFKSADFDNDGDIDLAATSTNAVRLALNNGSGIFTLASTSYAVGSGAFDLEITDFNDDGILDIATSNTTSQSISILLGQGAGAFTYGSTRTMSSSHNYLAVGDLNGDGAPDLLSSDQFDENFVFLSLIREVRANHEVQIKTALQAQKLLGILDNALENIGERRSRIGVLQNRLGYAESFSSLSRETLSAARSEILDVDLAQETAELARLQILQQAQVGVLAQSPVRLQMVLQLLDR
jgi:flagellin